MMVESVYQKCAGGCGMERELKEREARLWNIYPIRWWCQPCAERVEAEAAVKPLLDTLEKNPHLRAKLREILEMK